MVFLWDCFWFSIGFSCFSWVSMPRLKDFCWIPVGFPWYVYDISIGLLWDLYGMSMEVLCYFDGIPMASLWDFHRCSIVFLWYSMGFQQVAYGISMEFQWDFKVFPLDSHGISTGILQDFHHISIKFWWYFVEITIRFQKDSFGNWQGFL